MMYTQTEGENCRQELTMTGYIPYSSMPINTTDIIISVVDFNLNSKFSDLI